MLQVMLVQHVLVRARVTTCGLCINATNAAVFKGDDGRDANEPFID